MKKVMAISSMLIAVGVGVLAWRWRRSPNQEGFVGED